VGAVGSRAVLGGEVVIPHALPLAPSRGEGVSRDSPSGRMDLSALPLSPSRGEGGTCYQRLAFSSLPPSWGRDGERAIIVGSTSA